MQYSVGAAPCSMSLPNRSASAPTTRWKLAISRLSDTLDRFDDTHPGCVNWAMIIAQLTHPGWVSSNLSNVSDKRLMASFHRVVGALADRFGNDIEQGAAPTLYCISEPIPPGSYVGVDGRLGLKGAPTLSGRSARACDYEVAAQVVAFAERETGTTIPV